MEIENLNEKERIFDYAKQLKLNVFKNEIEDFIALATAENWSQRTLICHLLACLLYICTTTAYTN